ncbi:MAG: hypothetical protein ACP5E3_18845 [Bacteroidales bacterium]
MKLLILNFLFLFTVLFSNSLSSQYSENPLNQYLQQWNSRWISHPDIDMAAYGLIHFRNEFEIEEIPSQFIVHVSGDNRYRLYLNGKELGYGPQLSDIRHWRYETYDLAPFLQKGKNIIAAEIMNWGIDRSYGIISFRTGFLLQGDSEGEYFLNTNPGESKQIDSVLPTIHGNIIVKLHFTEEDDCSGEIQLPDGIRGVFEWKGQRTEFSGSYTL